MRARFASSSTTLLVLFSEFVEITIYLDYRSRDLRHTFLSLRNKAAIFLCFRSNPNVERILRRIDKARATLQATAQDNYSVLRSLVLH